MEVRVRERLIGALVLVAIVVLFVPAILKGRGNAPAEPPAEATRRVEVPTSDARRPTEESVLVPEPVADAAPADVAKRAKATAPAPPREAPPETTSPSNPGEPAPRVSDAAPPAAKPRAAAPAPARPPPAAPASTATAA